MPDGARGELVVQFDIGRALARLGPVAEKVMTEGANRMVKQIRKNWVGWAYDYWPYTAKGDKRRGKGTSGRKWRVEKMQLTEGRIRSIAILGDAKTEDGRYYTGYVHRRGTTQTEVSVNIANLNATEIPRIAGEIVDAVAKEITTGRPKRVRLNKNTEAVRAEMEL